MYTHVSKCKSNKIKGEGKKQWCTVSWKLLKVDSKCYYKEKITMGGNAAYVHQLNLATLQCKHISFSERWRMYQKWRSKKKQHVVQNKYV
jgi:hypothetical protein